MAAHVGADPQSLSGAPRGGNQPCSSYHTLPAITTEILHNGEEGPAYADVVAFRAPIVAFGA